MTFDYVGIRDNVAQIQIKDKGKLGTLLAPGDPTSGQPPWDPKPGADQSQSVWVVETSLRASDVDGTVVQATDSVYLVSPEGVISIEPTLKNRLRVEGETWQIVKVKRVKPGSVQLLWKVFVRK